MKNKCLLIVLVLHCLFLAQTALALGLAPVFTDHMVLQRNREIPVWGTAKPGSNVTVELGGAQRTATTDANGNWRVRFPARPASTQAISIVVSGDGQTRSIQDVLVGEVWFCSGQSNMGVNVAGAKGATEELAKADRPLLRLYSIPSGSSWQPDRELSWIAPGVPKPVWLVCTPRTAASFTAVGYVFGVEILNKLKDIPVGIINSPYGGAFIEPFIPRDLIKNSGKFSYAQAHIKKAEAVSDQQQQEIEKKQLQWMADRKLASESKKGIDSGWYLPDFDDSQWKTTVMPVYWNDSGRIKLDGTLWFRRTIQLDAQQINADRFAVGLVRILMRIWINGKELKQDPKTAGNSLVTYAIPPGTLVTGRNVISYRIYSMYAPGGVKKINPEDFSLQRTTEKGVVVADLAGDWRYEADYGVQQEGMPIRTGRTDFAVPGVIWNAMIEPWTPFPIAGTIWYQGESNVSRANEYTELLSLLINTWRTAWQSPDLPFLIVQLPNYLPRQPKPIESTWANLRAAQDRALSIPNTAMAVTYDVGDEIDIHPRDKRTVGERLALLAQQLVYGQLKPAEAQSPRATRAKLSGTWITVKFDPANKLKTSDGQLPRCIALAGIDGKFTWARAVLKGNTLQVSTEATPMPFKVRYAWADNPDANIFSDTNLPVAPFELIVEQ